MSEYIPTTQQFFELSAIALVWFAVLMGAATLILSFRHQSHSRNATTETEQTTDAMLPCGCAPDQFRSTARGSRSQEVNRQ